ncbi:TetR/AcrR family transcriptional regulator [Corynebacterium sp. 335C]
MTATARETILDAYAHLVVDGGTKAATLEAVAREAGVSKGGLLYHFPSKAKLAEGLAERLEAMVGDDVADLSSHPQGPTERLLRTSDDTDSAFTLCYDAVCRLAMNGDERARTSLRAAHRGWESVLEAEGADPVVARAVVLISDGLSLRSGAGLPYRAAGDGGDGDEIAEIIALVRDRLLPRG